MPHLVQNPMKIVWLVREIQVVEGFAKQQKTKEIFPFYCTTEMAYDNASKFEQILQYEVHFLEKSVKCWREDKPWMKYCKIETHD